MEYNISPDFPNSVWNAASVVLAILGAFGISSNLTIIITYLRNNSVSACFILITKLGPTTILLTSGSIFSNI